MDIKSFVPLPSNRIALVSRERDKIKYKYKDSLVVLDQDGNELWRTGFDKTIMPTLSVDGNGNIYLVLRTEDLAEEIKKQFTWFSKQGNAEIMVLDPDGRKLWHRRFGIGLCGSPVITAEGLVVFAGVKDNHLYAFKPNLP